MEEPSIFWGAVGGKKFPRSLHPIFDLMRRNGPQALGGARGMMFPTIATPKGPPIMLGYRWDPPITPYRLFIHIWNTWWPYPPPGD